MEVEIAQSESELNFRYSLRKKKLRQVRRREGRYLLRSNLTEEQPAQLWHLYIQLTQVEEAFKNLKGDLALRPLFHQKEARIEAHIFVSFLAYCLHVTLRRWLRDLAPGLSPRSVLDKFRSVQNPMAQRRTLRWDSFCRGLADEIHRCRLSAIDRAYSLVATSTSRVCLYPTSGDGLALRG